MWPYSPEEQTWLKRSRSNRPTQISNNPTAEDIDRAIARGRQLRAEAMAGHAGHLGAALRRWLGHLAPANGRAAPH